jgi:hypothetical protein
MPSGPNPEQQVFQIRDTLLLSVDIIGPVLDTSGPHSGPRVQLYFPFVRYQKVDIDRVLVFDLQECYHHVALFPIPATTG